VGGRVPRRRAACASDLRPLACQAARRRGAGPESLAKIRADFACGTCVRMRSRETFDFVAKTSSFSPQSIGNVCPVQAPLLSLVVRDRQRFIRRTFTLDARQIKRLKQQIIADAQGGAPALLRPPSSFVAVMALAWACSARSRPFPDDEDAFLYFFADARGRLDPPVCAEYIGACLTLCQARLPARELRGEGALPAAASAVQGAIRKMEEDPLDGWEFLGEAGKVPMDRFVNVSGSSSFRPYEVADFGWGRPRRTEPVRMNQDGQVALVRARDDEGVQVSVAMLQRPHMDAFKSEFLKLTVE
jgi:hypothetical protein